MVSTDLLANATRFGGYAAAEAKLFEVLGSWARQPGPPGDQRYFAETAAVHAERADAWRARVPAVPGIDVDASCTALPAELAAELDALEGAPAGSRCAAADAARLGLADLYRLHLSLVDPRLDGPTARLLHESIPA